MEVTVSKKEILSTIRRAQGVPEQKNQASVMAHVLLETLDDSTIRMVARSYELTLVTAFAGEVQIQGKLALSASSLFDAVRMLPDAPVKIVGEENHWARLEAGRTMYKVPGIVPDSFPELDEIESDVRVSMPAEDLLEAVDRVAFAMSQDEGRPNLNGVFMKLTSSQEGGGVAEMVATDGHRLARLRKPVSEVSAEPGLEAIVHKKGVSELRRFLADYGGEVELLFSASKVAFRTEYGFLSVQKIELEYPDYNRVIPTDMGWEARLQRGDLLDAVRRVSVVLTPDRTPAVRLEIRPGTMVVTASDPDKGQATSELDVEYEGGELSIPFNFKYLSDALTALDEGAVRIGARDPTSAVALRPDDSDDVLQLVMPIRY